MPTHPASPRSHLRKSATVACLAVVLVSSVASAQPTVTCGAGTMTGVDPAQAWALVALVCREVEARADERAPSKYWVSVERRHSSVVLAIDVTGPKGRDGRVLRLRTLDELPDAAPKVVRALIAGNPVTSPEDFASSVDEALHDQGEEAPNPGFLTFGLGGVGVSEGTGANVVLAGYRVETKRAAVGVDFRYSPILFNASFDEPRGANEKGPPIDVAGFALGGRYFLGEGSAAPYVGGGFGYTSVSFRRDEAWSSRGFMPNVEGGVTFGRKSSWRFDMLVRVDVPLQPATPDRGRSRESVYLLPVMLGLVGGF